MRPSSIPIALALLLVTATMTAAAPPAERLARLARGVNLSHWFAQSLHGYSAGHLRDFVSEPDMRRLRETGMTHVRLGVEPRMVAESWFVDHLDAAITRLIANDLAVVLVPHPVGDGKRAYAGGAGRASLIETWQRLARRFASIDPQHLFFEVLNEPWPLEGADWSKLQQEAIGVIRKEAPRHTVILNGGGWSTLDDLVASEPVADANAVYTLHYYLPYLFTHQGATWTWEMVRRIGPLSWPHVREDGERIAIATGRDEEARNLVRYEISHGFFELERIERDLEKLDAWRRAHPAAAVHLGEFGTFAAQAPRPAMTAWASAVRQAFEKRGIGWAYWDFSPAFGLVRSTAPGRELEPDMLAALGLPRR